MPTAGPLTTAIRGLGKSMKRSTKSLQARKQKRRLRCFQVALWKQAGQCEPWACGFKFNPQMSMNSNSFVGDFKRLFGKLFKFKPKFSQNSYFKPAIYKNDTKDFWWDLLYEPIIKFNAFIADKIGVFQNGRSNFYVVYILIYLYAMLVAGFYFLGA